ncbi:hypothetical protein [Cellulophaga sp. F20128]|uniref:hypothetical protein n=1 Tax=Cellulophaga sp. F20128 TaxID=2926413 RepID=UPI0032B24F4F
MDKTLSDKADKVLHLIEACLNGSLNDTRFGLRTRGDGQIAAQIHSLVKLAKQKYFANKTFPTLNTSLFEEYKNGQYKLF